MQLFSWHAIEKMGWERAEAKQGSDGSSLYLMVKLLQRRKRQEAGVGVVVPPIFLLSASPRHGELSGYLCHFQWNERHERTSPTMNFVHNLLFLQCEHPMQLYLEAMQTSPQLLEPLKVIQGPAFVSRHSYLLRAACSMCINVEVKKNKKVSPLLLCHCYCLKTSLLQDGMRPQ